VPEMVTSEAAQIQVEMQPGSAEWKQSRAEVALHMYLDNRRRFSLAVWELVQVERGCDVVPVVKEVRWYPRMCQRSHHRI
jgi:hypothetical protein